MKLAKKIMVAAIAVAAFGLMGCANIGGHSNIKSNGEGATVNGTNDGEAIIREMLTMKTKHSGGIWEVKQNVTNETGTEGVMGIVFNVTQNEDDTYNFIVVGTRVKNKQPDYYISYFFNIDEARFDDDNFGVTGTDKQTVKAKDVKNTTLQNYIKTGKPTELIVKDFSTLPTTLYKNNKFNVKVAALPTKDNDGNFTGSYQISFYSGDVTFDKNTAEITETPLAGYGETISNVFDPEVMVGAIVGEEGKKKASKVPQEKMGYYCNITAGATLDGEWVMTDEWTLNAAVEE